MRCESPQCWLHKGQRVLLHLGRLAATSAHTWIWSTSAARSAHGGRHAVPGRVPGYVDLGVAALDYLRSSRHLPSSTTCTVADLQAMSASDCVWPTGDRGRRALETAVPPTTRPRLERSITCSLSSIFAQTCVHRRWVIAMSAEPGREERLPAAERGSAGQEILQESQEMSDDHKQAKTRLESGGTAAERGLVPPSPITSVVGRHHRRSPTTFSGHGRLAGRPSSSCMRRRRRLSRRSPTRETPRRRRAGTSLQACAHASRRQSQPVETRPPARGD